MKSLNLDPKNVPLLAGEIVNANQQGIYEGMNSIMRHYLKPFQIRRSFFQPVIQMAQINCISAHPDTQNRESDTPKRCYL